MQQSSSDICLQISDARVPVGVPKLGPGSVKRQPKPTKLPMKNGPEIVNFRPVLESPATLANRRLQPLGHLTATRLLSIRQPASYGN